MVWRIKDLFGRSPLFLYAVPCLPYVYPMTHIFHLSNGNILKRWEIYPLSEQREYLCGEGKNHSAERTVMRLHHSVHHTWNTTHFHRLDNHWPWLGRKKPNFFRKPYYNASINKAGLVLSVKTQLPFCFVTNFKKRNLFFEGGGGGGNCCPDSEKIFRTLWNQSIATVFTRAPIHPSFLFSSKLIQSTSTDLVLKVDLIFPHLTQLGIRISMNFNLSHSSFLHTRPDIIPFLILILILILFSFLSKGQFFLLIFDDVHPVVFYNTTIVYSITQVVWFMGLL
jgi:hypothetical protein